MNRTERLRSAVELSLEQGEWLDHEFERTGISFAELIHEALLRLRAGPPARVRPDSLSFPYGERWVRRLTIHLKDARWADDESGRIGIHRAELVRQAIERLQMDRERGAD